MRYLRRLTLVHVSWLHAKLAIGVWAVLLHCFTPEKVSLSLGGLLVTAISALTLIGTVVSVSGLIASVQVSPSAAVRGLTVELVGLYLMFFGGLIPYFTTQFLLSFGPEGDQRIALSAFAYSMASLLVCRIALVTSRRRKEARS